MLVNQKINPFLCRVLFITNYFFMNIYVGNLNYRIRENDLRNLMEDFGPVESVKVIKDRDTGRSKGFAFIEMQNDDDAQRAIDELNEKEFEGRQLVVKVALPRT